MRGLTLRCIADTCCARDVSEMLRRNETCVKILRISASRERRMLGRQAFRASHKARARHSGIHHLSRWRNQKRSLRGGASVLHKGNQMKIQAKPMNALRFIEPRDTTRKSFTVNDLLTNFTMPTGVQSFRMFIGSKVTLVSYLKCCKDVLFYLYYL